MRSAETWAYGVNFSTPPEHASEIVLLLDTRGERLIEATADARDLAARIANEGGLLHPALKLPAQLARIGHIGAQPRLARLRLDRRGIGVPSTCWLARTVREDGSEALCVSLSELPLPCKSVRTEPVVEPEPAKTREPHEPAVSFQRVVWQCDAAGRIMRAEGGVPGIAQALLGRIWTNFPEGEGILASIRAGRTFRALGVNLYPEGASEAARLAVSGAPLSRTAPGVPTWAGFAILQTADTASVETVASADAQPVTDLADHHARSGEETGNADQIDGGQVAQPASTETADTRLSVPESDAFREIARALGATLSEPDAPDMAIRIGSLGAREPARPVGPSVSAILESLPAGVLVHRGREVIFTNRRLADLLRLETIAPTQADGPLDALLDERSGEGVVTVHGSGETVRLLVERSAIEWDGAQAELLLARAAPAVLHWLGAVAEAGGAFTSIARAQANPAPTEAPSVTLDPRGRLIMVDRKRDLKERGKQDTPPANPAPDANQEQPALDVPSIGAVVPLLRRVEQLLKSDEAAEPVEAAPGRQLERATSEARGRSDDTARRRFDFFKQIGETLRISLGSIGRTADLLLTEPSEPPTPAQSEPLRAIRAASIEALGVLDGLLAWTHVAAGRGEPERAAANLNEVVADCVAREQNRAAGGRIFLRSSLTSDTVTLGMDGRTVRRAALNAISHGIDRSRPGSQVIVSTSQAERGEVLLRVRSTGFTMSAEAIARTLEAVSEETSEETLEETSEEWSAEGTLGLTLAKVLVEESGGRFAIQSRDGEGTLIEIAFPPAQRAPD